MKFLVQFYSHNADKYVTISSHKTLNNAVKRARKEYTNTTHYKSIEALTILFIQKDGREERLTMYGTEQVDSIDWGL